MLESQRVGVSIRAVRGKRTLGLESLLGQLRVQWGCDFARDIRVSYHAAGRTVPESYCDAIATFSHPVENEPKRGWVLQLEDDIELAPCFRETVLRLLGEAERRQDLGLVTFYTGRRLAPGATRESLPALPILDIVPGRSFLMAQAIAFPIRMVESHNNFVMSKTTELKRPYATDTATGLWMAQNKLKMGVCWPGVVQHMAAGNSLYGHKGNSNRVSPSYRLAFGGSV